MLTLYSTLSLSTVCVCVSLCSNFIYIEVREDYEEREKKGDWSPSMLEASSYWTGEEEEEEEEKNSLSIELYVNK